MSTTSENVSFIKWKDTHTELLDLLKGHKKAELLELAETHAVSVRKSWNKTKISELLTEKITEQAETIYHPVLFDVLTRLPDLETMVYRVSDLNDITGFLPLIHKGFFFVSRDGDSILLLIPEEILFSVKDRLDLKSEAEEKASAVSTASADKNDKKAELLNSWKETTRAIYGIVSVSHLQTIWNRYFDEPITKEEVENILT